MNARSTVRLAVLGALALPATAPAQEWRLGASVSTGVQGVFESTDTPDDDAELGNGNDAQFTLRPELSLVRTGQRTSLALSAGARYRRSLDSGEEETEPSFGLAADVELVQRLLKVDLQAASRFTSTSPLGLGDAQPLDDGSTSDGSMLPDPDGNPDDGGDEAVDDRFQRVDTVALGIATGRTFAGRYRADAAYRFATTAAEDDERLGDTRSHAVGAAGRAFIGDRGRYAIESRASASTAEARDGRRATDVLGTIGLFGQITPRLGAAVLIGRDRVRVDTVMEGREGRDIDEPATEGQAPPIDDDSIDLSSTVYGAEVAWRPRRNLTARLAWLERSFGGSPRADITLTGRRSSAVLAWQRDLAVQQGFGVAPGALSARPDAGTDAAGESPSADPEPQAGDISTAAPSGLFARDLASVDERLSLSVGTAFRVVTLSAGVQVVRRETLGERNVEQRGTALSFGASRRLGRRASLAFTASHAIERNTSVSSGDAVGVDTAETADMSDGDSADATQLDDTDSDKRRSTRIALTLRVQLR